MRFCEEEINALLEQYDGNRSVIYPFVKDKLSYYKCEELPFPESFLFFEDKYLTICKEILKLNVNSVVDIGCELGIQSYLFKDMEYVGIDFCHINWFKTDDIAHKFIQGRFPQDTNIDLHDKTVISCMSIGYFSNEEQENLEINELSKAKYLFISSTDKVVNKLKPFFDESILLMHQDVAGNNYNLWFMKNIS